MSVFDLSSQGTDTYLRSNSSFESQKRKLGLKCKEFLVHHFNCPQLQTNAVSWVFQSNKQRMAVLSLEQVHGRSSVLPPDK